LRAVDGVIVSFRDTVGLATDGADVGRYSIVWFASASAGVGNAVPALRSHSMSAATFGIARYVLGQTK